MVCEESSLQEKLLEFLRPPPEELPQVDNIRDAGRLASAEVEEDLVHLLEADLALLLREQDVFYALQPLDVGAAGLEHVEHVQVLQDQVEAVLAQQGAVRLLRAGRGAGDVLEVALQDGGQVALEVLDRPPVDLLARGVRRHAGEHADEHVQEDVLAHTNEKEHAEVADKVVAAVLQVVEDAIEEEAVHDYRLQGARHGAEVLLPD
mmetsp:Transcript_88592/g.230949  ORF Transcript_88592/g.230949 Transcript_88592/m.230949 type:complete len:206 (-) Transcript_88592:307-924(-)